MLSGRKPERPGAVDPSDATLFIELSLTTGGLFQQILKMAGVQYWTVS